jgi:hypothetical protein
MAGSGRIDPKKWHLNPDTGEYHRITGWHKGQVFVDQRTYAQRLTDDYAEARHRRQIYISLVILGLMSWFGYKTFGRQDWVGILSIFALILGPFLFVATFIAALINFIRSFNNTVGPPPVPLPGREQVENQKVHGEGRVMTREEMDRALRGGAMSAQQQTFED